MRVRAVAAALALELVIGKRIEFRGDHVLQLLHVAHLHSAGQSTAELLTLVAQLLVSTHATIQMPLPGPAASGEDVVEARKCR